MPKKEKKERDLSSDMGDGC